MSHFTPVSALIGGAMIGGAAALLWLTMGRIAGVSGILAGVFAGPAADRRWRLAFLAGLIGAPLAGTAVWDRPAIAVAASPALLAIAGLLVGMGTRIGGGCTSGHSVCGLARLSPRSILATGLFMATAAATVFVTRHVIGG
jgi:uncharacterized membrane protein YedE/YeeE